MCTVGLRKSIDMWLVDNIADKLKFKLDEHKELKRIERDAYEAERCVVSGDNVNDKREAARQKGIKKAQKQSGGFSARLDRAAERMKNNKTKTAGKNNDVPSMIYFGPKV